MVPAFEDPCLLDALLRMSPGELDELPFGVIRLSPEGFVVAYNRAESRLSGLDPARVIGKHFFVQVAPCTNNAIVAGRFATDADLDEIVPYVFTFRMAPTAVRLRLLQRRGSAERYMVVERRP